jgi:hypothetical protein
MIQSKIGKEIPHDAVSVAKAVKENSLDAMVTSPKAVLQQVMLLNHLKPPAVRSLTTSLVFNSS